MKWLIVFPYIVISSTWSVWVDNGKKREPMPQHEYRVGTVSIMEDKEQAEDFAEALNEAHRRRQLEQEQPLQMVPCGRNGGPKNCVDDLDFPIGKQP